MNYNVHETIMDEKCFRRRSKAMCSFLLTVFGLVCASAGAASQLVNAGFENDLAGEFGGWKIPATGVWKVVDGAGRNGTRALVYETEDPNAKYAWVTQRVAVEGGRTYAYETWILGKDIRCDMQGATMFLSWRDKNGKPGEHWGMGSVRGTNADWSKCGAVVQIPEGVEAVTVNLILRNHSVGRACFDDVMLRPLDTRQVVTVTTSAYRDVVSGGPVTLKAILNVDEGKRPLETLAATFTTVAADGRTVTEPAAAFSATEASVEKMAERDFAKGTHPLVFTLREKATGRVLAVATNRLTRVDTLPARKVWIDSHGRFIVGGRPFFPLGLYCTTIDERLMSHVAKSPFNTLMPYDRPRTTKPLDLAAAADKKVFYQLIDYFAGNRHAASLKTVADEWQVITNRVLTYRDHPALLGWYMSDEQPLSQIDSLARHQRWMEELDPDHPTWTVTLSKSERPCAEYAVASDVVGNDPYPIGIRRDWQKTYLAVVAAATRAMVAGMHGVRGTIQVPQVFDWTAFRPDAKKDYGARAPTREEMRNMFWQMIACGANGLMAYTFNEKHLAVNGKTFEERWADICAVGEEIRAKMPILLSVEPTPTVADVPAGLCVRTWRSAGRDYLVAVNTGREPVRTTLRTVEKDPRTLDVSLGPIDVMFKEMPKFGDETSK